MISRIIGKFNIIKLLILIRKVPIIGQISCFLLRFLGIHITRKVSIGKNLSLVHWGCGVVIHPNTVIKDNVKIYQGVTLGRGDINVDYSQSKMEKIILEDGAIICAGAKVICKEGILKVGKNTIIGANSVLLQSTGDNEVWVGMPARRVK